MKDTSGAELLAAAYDGNWFHVLYVPPLSRVRDSGLACMVCIICIVGFINGCTNR